MSIRKKLDMTPKEAAYVVVLKRLQDACDFHSMIQSTFLNEYDHRKTEGQLSDGEVQQIYKQYAAIHNRLADKAEELFGLDSVRL